jgi:uncharacterized DUF497 family protein
VKWEEERLAECSGFLWDAGNSAKIWDRHHFMPTECEELFFNRPLIVGSDEKHSAGEARFYALGQTDGGRLLFVVFTIRGRLMRVISARDMSRKSEGFTDRHEKGTTEIQKRRHGARVLGGSRLD